jgi:Restriction endonuclease
VTDTPAWRVYERVVAAFEVDDAEMGTSVTPNASLIGGISGVRRQIDVLVDARFENDGKRRIIFDAKKRSRKVDVKDVESFEGMMRDVGASRGVLVCTKGYTEGARRRADQLIDVRIMEEDEALEHDFSLTDPCPHCADLKKKRPGIIFWDGQFPLPLGPLWAIVFTGKCDECRSFAFWCWDCGDKKVVPDGVVHECGCERRWFTEADDDEVVFVVALDDGEVPLDRRPLR